MGIIPVTMHSASLDVLRNALSIRLFISLCTMINFILLYEYFIASVQIGSPYSKRGNIAPLYIVFRASFLSPHVTLADLDKL